MRKLIIIIGAAAALAGCETVKQDRALTGGVIGGIAGTAIGAATGGGAGAAVAGGLIGAGTGALIGSATAPKDCYYRTSSGRTRRC